MTLQLLRGRWRPILCPPSGALDVLFRCSGGGGQYYVLLLDHYSQSEGCHSGAVHEVMP